MGAKHALLTATAPAQGCLGASIRPTDLMFLLWAAADRMVLDFDRAARDIGLSDARDWMVLSALEDGQDRTQLELSKVVCVDKTTLISVLDRLESSGLVERTVSPTDRRVRIPRITERGRKAYAKFASARDDVESRALDGIDEDKRAMLLDLLAQIADRPA